MTLYPVSWKSVIRFAATAKRKASEGMPSCANKIEYIRTQAPGIGGVAIASNDIVIVAAIIQVRLTPTS